MSSKHFLSVLKITTKVLLTIWQSVHPFGCYKRIFGFVLRTVNFTCELKFFTQIKSILKVVSLIAIAISFPLMPAKSLCDENRGRYQRFYNRKWYGNLSIASFKSDLTHLNELNWKERYDIRKALAISFPTRGVATWYDQN